ncbi:helix-turn-helix domain-containing protein [bacterium]
MLAEQIRKYRKKSNLSQQKLAEKAGMSIPTITSIEHGRSQYPKYQTIQKIALALKVSIDELMGKTNRS